MPPDTPLDNAALELQNVSKFFGDLPALKGVSLRIGVGESVLVYGPNGAGKTTLLRLLAGLGRPTEGRVLLGGQDLHRHPTATKAALGFVSHATFLYGDLTARENLRFMGRLFALPHLESKIDAALELFKLNDRAGVPVRELSRGFQQRVTLARAFLHDPRFLLLDEPFTGLDAETRENMAALLRRVPEQGKALIFSTHDFDQGAALAGRLVALKAGRASYDGPLKLAPFEALQVALKRA
jgi:heme ABC exporter ATP-binding subunit CcmA